MAGASSSSSSSSRRWSGHVVQRRNNNIQKRTCLCSPTTHPGSFRCALHKNMSFDSPKRYGRLNMRRSAMTNSLVRMGKEVEGDLLIRPSSLHQRRRAGLQPCSSRLSVMTKAEDL